MLNPRKFLPAVIENDNSSPNEKWRQNHPLRVTINVKRFDAGSLMPTFIGKPTKGFCSSVEDNSHRKFIERQDNVVRRDLTKVVRRTIDDHGMIIGVAPKSTKQPVVHTNLNSVASFINHLFDDKKMDLTGNVYLIWSPTFKYNVGLHLKFDPITKVEKFSVKICYTPKWVRESSLPLDIQPYCNIFNNGFKKIGINFPTLPTRSQSKNNLFQKFGESDGLSEENLSENITSSTISSSEVSKINIPSSKVSKIGQTYSEEKGYFEKIAKYVDDTSRYLGGKIDKGYLEVAAFRSLQRDKLGYLYIAVILIFISIVALRVSKRAKTDGLIESRKKYKIINFILSSSTQNSSLALSFFLVSNCILLNQLDCWYCCCLC